MMLKINPINPQKHLIGRVTEELKKGGVIIVTKCDAVSLARSGIGTISFEGKVSGAAMECVGTGT